jgi:hypothetical protein
VGDGRRHTGVLDRQTSAAAASARRVVQIVRADDRGVLGGLVCGQMRYEPRIAAGDGVAVYDENASGRAGISEDLPLVAIRVDVAAERARLRGPAPAPRARALRRLTAEAISGS